MRLLVLADTDGSRWRGGAAIGRLLIGILGIGLLVVGALFIGDGCRADRELEAALEAEPIRIPVDLSKPGTYQGTFSQTYTHSHGEQLWVELNPPFESAEAAQAALKGLSARAHLANNAREIVLDTETTGRILPASATGPAGRVLLFHFHPFPKGEYTFSLEVLEPAPTVAGREQQLVARYFCCGLERWSALVSYGIGSACVFLSLAVGWLAYWLTVRRRRTMRPVSTGSPESTDPDAELP